VSSVKTKLTLHRVRELIEKGTRLLLSLKVHGPVHNSPSLDPCVLPIYNINTEDEKYLVNNGFIIVTRK
jgi:hypothetical protein